MLRKASYKITHIVWFHLYRMSRVSKYKETEHRLCLPEMEELGGNGVIAKGHMVSFWGDEIDGGWGWQHNSTNSQTAFEFYTLCEWTVW